MWYFNCLILVSDRTIFASWSRSGSLDLSPLVQRTSSCGVSDTPSCVIRAHSSVSWWSAVVSTWMFSSCCDAFVTVTVALVGVSLFSGVDVFISLKDCTLPHLLRRKLPDSSGFHWNPPESNPGMSWCDKGQTSIFIPGGVRRSPLETSIFRRSPQNPSGLFPLRKSTGLWRNPVE